MVMRRDPGPRSELAKLKRNGRRVRGATAFTLVEISVVFIVIALLAGLVLLGTDLRRLAAIRSQIRQLEQFNEGAAVFRLKFAGIPGDLRAEHATALGFQPRSGARGHGDGNGLIEDCNADVGGVKVYGCEYTLFWSDLGDASLVAGQFAGSDAGADIQTAEAAFRYFPAATLVTHGQLIVNTDADRLLPHWLSIMRILEMQPDGSSTSWSSPVIPADAEALDRKLDDGDPARGSVHVLATPILPGPFATGLIGGPGLCTENGQYNLTVSEGVCQVNAAVSTR